VTKIDRKYKIERDAQLALSQLIEELGELAKEINRKKLRRENPDSKKLEDEFADVFLQFAKLAEMHEVDLEKSVLQKIGELKKEVIWNNPMKLLDGKKLAEKILRNVRDEVSKMKKKPVLAMVLVGNDPASSIYVRRKGAFCEKAGIDSRTFKFPASISEKKLLRIIGNLNKDKNVTAIMVQLPLPEHIDKNKIIEAIDPRKDADCLHPLNFGRFVQSGEKYSVVAPATPLGIVKLLEEYKVKIEGKNAVVVGRSNIVGKPAAQFLMNRGATVTVCHRHTKNLAARTREADILVVAAGKKHLIKAGMVKRGVIVVDVGVNRTKNRRGLTSTVCGDVDFAAVSKKASYITPVPGGVGPVTIAMLLWNTIDLTNSK